MATEWMDNLLSGNIEKEAQLIPQGENKEAHDALKMENSNWVKEAMEIDEVAVEAEYKAKQAEEARMLGKKAAYEMDETMKETIEKDYSRDVKALSDYVLAEMLAEYRANKNQITNEQFYEMKEKAKANVASGREKCEKELLDLVGKHTQIDWKESFAKFSKDAKPEEPKEKDLFEPKAPEEAHKFDSPSEDKFKTPKDQEKAIPGNGREADERTDATKEAGVLQKDLTEGLGKVASKMCTQCEQESKTSPCEECKKLNKKWDYEEKHGRGSYKEADKVTNSPSDKTENLAMPEGKKSADDKPVEAVEEPTAGSSSKTVGDKDDQAAEANGPEKGEKAKTEEAVQKKESSLAKVAEVCPVCNGEGEDLGALGQKDHFRCQNCGITFSHDKEASCDHCASLVDLTSKASKDEVIKMVKEAALKNPRQPWIVKKMADGTEAIVKNTVESEVEPKEDEITK